jgi:hypothetical protein
VEATARGPLEWLVVIEPPSRSQEAVGANGVCTDLRRLSADETERSQVAIEFLFGLTEGGALQDLRGCHEDLLAEIGALRARPHTTNTRAGAGLTLERAFSTFLGAFVSYCDRTKHWVSSQCGPESPEYLSFKSWLSEEFDANFAYRLAYGLRNASLHQGRVVNGLSFRSREVESGAAEDQVVIQLHCQALARTFTGITPKIRNEMLEAAEPVELEWVVRGVVHSCQRIQARLFQALRRRIDEAAATIEGFDAEAAGPAQFEMSGFFDAPTMPSATWRLRVNRADLAVAARDGVTTSDRVLREFPEPEVWSWRDFVDPDGDAEDLWVWGAEPG